MSVCVNAKTIVIVHATPLSMFDRILLVFAVCPPKHVQFRFYQIIIFSLAFFRTLLADELHFTESKQYCGSTYTCKNLRILPLTPTRIF